MSNSHPKDSLWALQQMGLTPSSIELIAHEDTLSSEVYRLVLQRGKRCILKLCHNTDRFRKERYYLTLVQGVIPVPKILDTLPPEPGFSGALLLEEVQGNVLKNESISEEEAYQMGEILAKLHAIPVDSYGDLSLPKEMRKKTTPLLLMKNYFESSLSECKGFVDERLLNHCYEYVHSNLHLFLGATGPCLTHRDFRPGNALSLDGKVQAIIDFEIAGAAFAEEDFAQMQMLAWNTFPHSKKPFLQGYQEILPLPQSLNLLMPLLLVLKSLGAIGFTCDRKTHETRHAQVFLRNLAYIKEFFN